MRIDSVATRPDRAGRYWIKFSDGKNICVYRQTLEDFGLYAGMELSREQVDALEAAAGSMSAKMRAVRIVAAANVSKKDLESRLLHKGESPEDAKEAVTWMESLELLDDRRTAEQLVRQCIYKGYGLEKAKQVLYEKRIPKEYWDDILTDYPDQIEHILSFLRGRLDSASDAKCRKRAIDALLRRGHSYSVVYRAMKQLNFEEDEFPEEC